MIDSSKGFVSLNLNVGRLDVNVSRMMGPLKNYTGR